MLHYVYLIENQINKKAYTGYTSNYIKRWATETRNLNKGLKFNGCKNHKLLSAWKKYKKENFLFRIHSICDTKEEALEKEKRIEAFYSSVNMLYNMIPGGGKFITKFGRDNPNFGKRRSEETRTRISISITEKSKDPEYIRKKSEAAKGKIVSEETKIKRAEMWAKKRLDPNCIHANTGKIRTEEARKNVSNAHLGKPWSSKRREAHIKSGGVFHCAFGEEKPIIHWVKDPRCVVTKYTLEKRLKEGWDFREALSTPLTKK